MLFFLFCLSIDAICVILIICKKAATEFVGRPWYSYRDFRPIFGTFRAVSRAKLLGSWVSTHQNLEGYSGKHDLSRSITKNSHTASNHTISAANWHQKNTKSHFQETSDAITPKSTVLCGMWHRPVETTYPPHPYLRFPAKKNRYYAVSKARTLRTPWNQ